MNDLAGLHCTPISADSVRLDEMEINQLKGKIEGWQVVDKNGELRLEKEFAFKDFTSAAAFTGRVAAVADREDHHPAILTEWGKVTVTWWTHKIKGLHRNDFVMAAKTEQLYKE